MNYKVNQTYFQKVFLSVFFLLYNYFAIENS